METSTDSAPSGADGATVVTTNEVRENKATLSASVNEISYEVVHETGSAESNTDGIGKDDEAFDVGIEHEEHETLQGADEAEGGPPRASFYELDLPLLHSFVKKPAIDDGGEESCTSSICLRSLQSKVIVLTSLVFRKVDMVREESLLRLNLRKLAEVYEAYAPKLEVILLWVDYGSPGKCDVRDEEAVEFMRKSFPKFGMTPRQEVFRGRRNETVGCVLNAVDELDGPEDSEAKKMESFP